MAGGEAAQEVEENLKAGEDEEQSWKNVSSLDFKIIMGQFFHH